MADTGTSFKMEKQNVLGELSNKFRKFSTQEDDLPPPPPVFQTYGTPVPGPDEEDLPPPPPFLNIKEAESCTPPPPPPPPSISPPDYTKLSPRKQEDDNCIKPKLNPVPQSPGRLTEYGELYSNPYINKRSENYADSLLRPNLAEKKILPNKMENSRVSSSPPPPPRQFSATPPSPRRPSETSPSPRRTSVTPPPHRRPSTTTSSSRKTSETPPSPRKPSMEQRTSVHRPSIDMTLQELNLIESKMKQNGEKDNIDRDTCYNCKERMEGDGIIALERAYHKDCFKCLSCEKIIQARFNVKDKEPYCDVCFEEKAERCSICEGLITGDSLKSGEKYYHTECMKCSVCGKELSGTYFTTGKALVCEEDYKSTLEKCSVCGDILTGAFFKVGSDNICEKDYKNQLSSCQVCQKPVEGKLLKLSDKVYHPDCFNCSVCDKNLAGVAFTQDDEKRVHCTECFQKKHASICAGCNFAIIPEKGETTAERIRVQGKDFHPKCFKCEDCGLKFDSRTPGHECYPLDIAFLCRVCNLARCNNKA